MKILVNCNWSGYNVPYAYEYLERDDKELINAFEKEYENAPKGFGLDKWSEDLKIAVIPENATDYRILENDGYEEVLCVVDGKIVDAKYL